MTMQTRYRILFERPFHRRGAERAEASQRFFSAFPPLSLLLCGERASRHTSILSAALLALFVLLTAACNSKSSAEQSKPPAATASPAPSQTPTVTVTAVTSQEVNRQLRLPGELLPYQDVALYAKVQGFVEKIYVDRGSVVRRGQLLAEMSAPEMAAQFREAEAKARSSGSQRIEAEARVQGIRAQRLEAEAKLAADEGTYRRLKAASATPGAVAGNDVDIAARAVEASRARVQLYQENEKAALAQVKALADSEQALREAARSVQSVRSYLRITAPFDGVVTERNVHPGSLAGPSGGASSMPMLRVQQVSRLRLVVPVPEAEIGGVKPGTTVSFTVPAFPGEVWRGSVTRVSRALDAKTRTMPVELDVMNPAGKLAPGMFPEVTWPARRARASLFVPATAVATTTEKVFVVRVREGVTEWVDVKKGVSVSSPNGDLIEVFGDLSVGDQVAVRGTDELRAGVRVNVKQAASR
jgi:membrane fusion protein, multidrug efflux system